MRAGSLMQSRRGYARIRPLAVLASASPRRAHILDSLGVPYRVAVSAVSEDIRPGEAPSAAAERLGRAKAAAAAAPEGRPVPGAATIVGCDQAVLGQPPPDAGA